MKLLALLLAIPLFIGIPSTTQARGTPQDTQEACEKVCISCLENDEGEGSFCMALYRACCNSSGGTLYNQCGCRIEM